MALEGTLKDFALPDIFQLIGLQKKTGTLLLKDDSDEISITFKDGSLVFADSKNKRIEGRLGTRLTRSGLITESQLEDVLEKQKQTLQRLGVLLVNDGFVKQEDLRSALELQVTQIVYGVFRWDDAYYRFDQEDQIDYDAENVTPMRAESVLMEGMRILDEWPIVEKLVPSLRVVFEKVAVDQPVEVEGSQEFDPEADDFDFDLGGGSASDESGGDEEKITLTADEGAVYQHLDGTHSLEDVMYLARLADFDVAKAAYDLLNRDLIREKGLGGAAPAKKAAPGVAAQTVTPEASPLLVAALFLVLFALIVGGVLFHRLNPLNGDTLFVGMRPADVERQRVAATASRLDRIAWALEAHRLAFLDESYPEQLDDLVDLGFIRAEDLASPWEHEIRYKRNGAGSGWSLEAVDGEGRGLTGLLRVSRRGQVGDASTGAAEPAPDEAEASGS